MNRIIATLAALFLGLGLMSATATGANAAPASETTRVASAEPANTTPTALPRRRITMDAVRVTNTSFRMRGTLSPKYTGKIHLQYKRCKTCSWSKIRTTRAGGYRYVFSNAVGRLGFYRAMTPKGTRYAKSFSNVIRLYRA